MADKSQCLPNFAVTSETTIDFWPIPPDLTYSEANALGRERANELIDTMRRKEAPFMLGHVLEAMIRGGKPDGVVIGFCHVLAEELMQPPVTEFVEVPVEHFPILKKQRHMRLVGGTAS